MYYVVSTFKLLEIYLKMLKEKIVMSDKTEKMVDDNLHVHTLELRAGYQSLLALKGNPA